ncbi:hypothetical protein GRF29_8g424887 [Pseudopithomyces chartarum]|uniref:Cytochrome P450 n=1 Tax=Pseudopithomyces chartarum TaxID=1892770 RepID=A0AAN6M776_9PLEO|nr:hypothetical protein GRF29_8g424887 [Pseudopithomyces chartarum]
MSNHSIHSGVAEFTFANQIPNACQIIATSLIAIATVAIIHCVYNLYFHPLSSYPGPPLWCALRLPYVIRAVQGRLVYDMLDLHKRYGPVVRVAPNELSLAYEGVWDDVLGGTYDNELPRWKPFYRVQPNQKQMIFTAPPDEHSKMRRALSYGFSDRGIREMESRMGRMLSKMLCRLADVCDQDRTKPTANKQSEATSGVVDLTKWCNFMTFDMIGELAFGESFECLEKLTGIIGLLGFYPKFQDLLLNVFGGVICRRMDFHQKHSRAAIERRAMKPDRKDLLTEPLKQTQMQAEPEAWDDLAMNAGVLVVAGSETTATTLTAVLFFLLTNKEAHERLVTEVRNAFANEDEISIASVNKLEYLLACLNETMRILPAVPVGLPRMVPKGGRIMNGKLVPEDTIVAGWHWALYHNDTFFQRPFEFHPERFLGEEQFASDARDLLQPFHIGRRACIGRSLAYAEMRLALARMIFKLDMEITDESRNWIEQLGGYNFWYKPPLYVQVTERCTGA